MKYVVNLGAMLAFLQIPFNLKMDTYAVRI